MSDRPAEPDGDRVEATMDEHRACMRVVSEVEACLDRQPERGGHWVAELQDKLRQLGDTLARHFEGEQQGPMFRKLPLTHPQYADRLTRLEQEHDEILERVRGVLDRAGRLPDGQARIYEIRELNAHTQLLVATIRRHEAEENELLLAAHWDEIGVGD